MKKIKVLTVQFDVSHMSANAIDSLMAAVIAQGDGIAVYDPTAEFCTARVDSQVLNTSVKEVSEDKI